MASNAEVEFLKVLACMAWADRELTRSEMNVIGRLMHDFQLSGEERHQVEIYLEENVDSAEARRITRRFLSRVRRPGQRRQLVAAVEHLLESDDHFAPAEKDWLKELHDAVAESSGNFLLDGLRSLLRLGATGADGFEAGREAYLHDFIHNRVLFKLRHRVGAETLERETKPERLKELTLCAAFLAHVGYVDETFLPQEKQFIEKLLRDDWSISPDLAAAVTDVAMEAARAGLDLYRLLQESKALLSLPKRKTLVTAMFELTQAEGKLKGQEVEEIRKIAHGLELTHREFINAKLKALGKA